MRIVRYPVVGGIVLYDGIDLPGEKMVLCKLLATSMVFGRNDRARAHFVFSAPTSARVS